MNNKIHNAIDSVHAEEALKQNTKAFLASKVNSSPRRSHAGAMAAAFACLALILLGVGGWRLYITPVSAVSVDINPSVELGINRFDKIVSVEGYNQDGDALAAELDIMNMDYSDGLETIVTGAALRPYLDNGGLVSITVLGSTDEKSEEMRARISSCAYASGPNVECRCGSRENVAAAHEAGLSFGKYQAFLELKALDSESSVEEVQSMTMRQIRDRINELSGKQSQGTHGNGNGTGGRQHHGGE